VSGADTGICEKGGPVSHLSFLSVPLFFTFLPPLPSPVELVPLNQLGVWERRKLPQWGPGGAPAENEFCAL